MQRPDKNPPHFKAPRNCGEKPSPDGRLGIFVKCSSPPPETQKRRGLRAERYRLLGGARQIFMAEGHRQELEFPANFHKTAKCRFARLGMTQIHRSRQHSVAFYGGLETCGSVWACPVCSAKVQERRREEIAQAFDWAYARGKKMVMVTLTFPHYQWSDLPQMMTQQADALRRLRSGKVWQRVKARAGYGGLIRALEITFGKSGWHPHTHEVWVVDADCDVEWLRAEILRRWEACCTRAGLLPETPTEELLWGFRQHSVDVIDNARSSEYLAKMDDEAHWGADRELAKASTKRSQGKHPFGLLDDACGGSKRAAQLFLDYALAMKGKRQLFWSRGLKAAVGLEDLDDEAIAEESRDNADLLALLTKDQWLQVLADKARAEILDIAEDSGYQGLCDWFTSRGHEPPEPPNEDREASRKASSGRGAVRAGERFEALFGRQRAAAASAQQAIAVRLRSPTCRQRDVSPQEHGTPPGHLPRQGTLPI